MQYNEFRAMNTRITLAAEGSPEALETGFSVAQAYIQAAEKRFTRFSEDSELSALNRSSGTWFSASAEMAELLTEAVRLHHQTGGLFDPSVLNALEQAGYDRSFEELRSAPGAYAEPKSGNTWRYRFADVCLEEDGRRVWLPPEMRIDLGGIAKGWIAEQAAQRLAAWSTACAVDAGGDLCLVGLPAGESAWHITLEDPNSADNDLAVLTVQPGAVATSAVTKRRWQQAGTVRHHLIDPRTHLPAKTGWLSVTAIAAHAAEAEVYAKSLLIGGAKEADRLAAGAEGLEFIAVDLENRLWGSAHSREVLHV
jgi:thiamine biosynthesis lipoprotein